MVPLHAPHLARYGMQVPTPLTPDRCAQRFERSPGGRTGRGAKPHPPISRYHVPPLVFRGERVRRMVNPHGPRPVWVLVRAGTRYHRCLRQAPSCVDKRGPSAECRSSTRSAAGPRYFEASRHLVLAPGKAAPLKGGSLSWMLHCVSGIGDTGSSTAGRWAGEFLVPKISLAGKIAMRPLPRAGGVRRGSA